MSVHKVSITSDNVAPLADLEITQNGRSGSLVAADGGPVNVALTVHDINSANSHTYDWSMTDSVLLVSNPGAADAQFMFDPTGLLPGFFKVAVAVTDNEMPNLAVVIEYYLQVIATAPTLTTQNRDNDDVDDTTEGFDDSDNDGIPDYLDGLDNNPELMQSSAGVFDQWLINARPGLELRLGTISLVAGNHIAGISEDDITQIAGSLGGPAPANTTDSYNNVGGYFDIAIHGLGFPGQSVLVVIPQAAAIPDDAEYRKYTETDGWTSFAEDINNALSSAAGEAGICPAPGDPAYVPGLNPGHYCVQIRIEDGAANDDNAHSNGVISILGGVGRLNTTPPDSSTPSGSSLSSNSSGSSGSGGGSISIFILLLMLGLRCLKTRFE